LAFNLIKCAIFVLAFGNDFIIIQGNKNNLRQTAFQFNNFKYLCLYKVLGRKPEGKSPLREQSVDGRMESKWTLENLAGTVWSGFTWTRTGAAVGLW
jgi:hypothetical protein